MFTDKNHTSVPWRPENCDLNPIEYMWDVLRDVSEGNSNLRIPATLDPISQRKILLTLFQWDPVVIVGRHTKLVWTRLDFWNWGLNLAQWNHYNFLTLNSYKKTLKLSYLIPVMNFVFYKDFFVPSCTNLPSACCNVKYY